jgi:hypothetical protein
MPLNRASGDQREAAVDLTAGHSVTKSNRVAEWDNPYRMGPGGLDGAHPFCAILRATCGHSDRQSCRCVIAKLAALVPPPRPHLTRFHGVFAPNAHLRAQSTPSGRGKRPATDESKHAVQSNERLYSVLVIIRHILKVVSPRCHWQRVRSGVEQSLKSYNRGTQLSFSGLR